MPRPEPRGLIAIHAERLGARLEGEPREPLSPHTPSLAVLKRLAWPADAWYSTPARPRGEVGHVWRARFGVPYELAERPGWWCIGEADGGNDTLLMHDATGSVFTVDHDEPGGRPRECGDLAALFAHLLVTDADFEPLYQANFPYELPSSVASMRPIRGASAPYAMQRLAQLARAMAVVSTDAWVRGAEDLGFFDFVRQELSHPEMHALAELTAAFAARERAAGTRHLDYEDFTSVLCEQSEDRVACRIVHRRMVALLMA